MGVWRDKTPRKDDEITRPDPGPVNPAGKAPGHWGRSGRRPEDAAIGHVGRRMRKPKAS
ncbi:hypothetical protein [Streptomyces qinzhouensis]|uniref:hypothetical protein n=1 Tax=Streptomyces qinzhouensis TaxID=2599401 RepID=UPI0016480C60|nr:hypothetical protein [Streptomyces qinzhouensis]